MKKILLFIVLLLAYVINLSACGMSETKDSDSETGIEITEVTPTLLPNIIENQSMNSQLTPSPTEVPTPSPTPIPVTPSLEYQETIAPYERGENELEDF